MDTKWRSNKRFFSATSVTTAYAAGAAVVGMVAALIFMSLFPFFRERAQAAYSDPLISRSFVDDLFSLNYVQYKYLREQADQTQYTFSELYLEQTLESDEADASLTGGSSEAMEMQIGDTTYVIESDNSSHEQIRQKAERIVTNQQENLESVLSEYEQMLASYGGMMDYYVEDLDSGTVLSNSGSSLPDAVSKDGQGGSGSSDYVYYVSLEYDSAGNVGNVSVRCQDNAKQFINTVQTAGHERQLSLYEDGGSSQELDQSGQTSTYQVYDEYDDQYMVLRLTLSSPADMRVIYGLTQEQYEALLWSESDSSSRTDLYLALENSYHDAGVAPAYLVLLFLCAAAGLIRRSLAVSQQQPETAAFVGQKEAGEALNNARYMRRKRGLYIETAAVLAIILIAYSVYPVTRFTAEYENGIFLQGIRAGLGNNGSILRIPLDRAAMFLFLAVLFAIAFLIGSGLSGIRRSSLKERSLICKYWHKVYSRIKRAYRKFYTELVSYDIGTDANRIILKVLGVNFFILVLICCFWFAGILGLIVYTVIVYFILKRYVIGIQEKYRKLLRATSSIAQGNLDTALSEDFGIFESYKSQLRRIQVDFKRAVDEEVKSQRMKTELITNVSHDLKTPLTAIITYIDLLKEPGVTEEKKEEYLAVLQKKANRLKVLIEDLFEISKASSKAVTLQIVDVDICNLLRQAYLEQEDRISAANLDFRFRLPEKKIILSLDSQKTYRIFDNLYTNIIKYALKGTRVYVTLTEEKERSSEGNLSPASSGKNREYVRIELKNISASELSVDPNELTERFVRGDGSRNTEGSGLGLAIAKSFAELQGGSMRIEVDGDLFKAILTFPQKDKAMDGGNAQEQVPKGDQIHPASPHPPIPWNKNSNRFYRKNDMRTPASAEPGENIFSSRNMFSIDGTKSVDTGQNADTVRDAETLPHADRVQNADTFQKKAERSGKKDRFSGIRNWLKTLWFGKRR